MSINKVLDILRNTDLVNQGFQLNVDKDKNVSLLKETEKTFLSLSIPISKKNFTLYTPNTTISFKKLQGLWVDLCFEAITKKLDFKVTSKWRDENYPSFTTQMYRQVNTPSGIIESKFKELTVPDYFNLEGIDNRSIEADKYLEYLTDYYYKCSAPFFKAIPDIFTLDKLTDGLDMHNLPLYLSDIPILKKVLLTKITNNPNKETYFDEYSAFLTPHKETPNVAPIYASLMKIKDYFANHPA